MFLSFPKFVPALTPRILIPVKGLVGPRSLLVARQSRTVQIVIKVFLHKKYFI